MSENSGRSIPFAFLAERNQISTAVWAPHRNALPEHGFAHSLRGVKLDESFLCPLTNQQLLCKGILCSLFGIQQALV